MNDVSCIKTFSDKSVDQCLSLDMSCIKTSSRRVLVSACSKTFSDRVLIGVCHWEMNDMSCIKTFSDGVLISVCSKTFSDSVHLCLSLDMSCIKTPSRRVLISVCYWTCHVSRPLVTECSSVPVTGHVVYQDLWQKSVCQCLSLDMSCIKTSSRRVLISVCHSEENGMSYSKALSDSVDQCLSLDMSYNKTFSDSVDQCLSLDMSYSKTFSDSIDQCLSL